MRLFHHIALALLVASVTTHTYAGSHHRQDTVSALVSHTSVSHAVGDHDYHKFGKVVMNREGNKYFFITFPFFQYTGRPVYKADYKPEDDLLPTNTQLVITLRNGQIIKSTTAEDTKVLWYFWREFNGVDDDGNEFVSDEHLSHEKIMLDPYPSWYHEHPGHGFTSIYGMSWIPEFQFTPADMQLLAHSSIKEAGITRNGSKIVLPLKYKQASKIRKTARSFIHN